MHYKSFCLIFPKAMLFFMLCTDPLLYSTASSFDFGYKNILNQEFSYSQIGKKQAQVFSEINQRLNKKSFLVALKRGAPWWMEAQIQDDLAPFSTGISTERVDEVWSKYDKEAHQLVRFTIKNRKISYQVYQSCLSKDCCNHRFNSYLYALQILNLFIGLPNVDFVISLHDAIPLKEDLLFCCGKRRDVAPGRGILVPDPDALRGHVEVDFSVEKGVRKYSWENRLKKAFWRGSITGGTFTNNNWDQFPRTQLALHSLESPDLLDAKITSVCQVTIGSNVREILLENGLMGNSIPIENHLQYRYLIDVDGNAMTWPRNYWILLSGSLLLKQQGDYILWYSRGVIPYVHYVPFISAADDLDEVIEWAREHDDEARRIALEGRRFAKEDLSIENTYLYLFKVLVAYSALQ